MFLRLLSESECKGTAFLNTDQMFGDFFFNYGGNTGKTGRDRADLFAFGMVGREKGRGMGEEWRGWREGRLER